MVRPVSFKGFQKGFQGVSLRGFRGFQIFLWELCVCIKYLSLGDVEYRSGDISFASKHIMHTSPANKKAEAVMTSVVSLIGETDKLCQP